jgi:hypothetical protein
MRGRAAAQSNEFVSGQVTKVGESGGKFVKMNSA